MKIAILGYGKMGKEIEKVALERNQDVILKIDHSNADTLTDNQLEKANVAIEFSNPENAVDNIKRCFALNVPIVVGTTGWYQQWDEIKRSCRKKNGTLLAATNFSVGVNIFFALNRQLAKLMENRSEYYAKIEETHHTEKKDSPSGTAISLADDLININPVYSRWKNAPSDNQNTLSIISHREKEVPGTHVVRYNSDIDTIDISHTAKSRKGFALGAVLAAEFIKDKSGIFNMKDVLKI